MNEKEFAEIVSETKGVVLSAIEKNLAERFYHAIDDVAQEAYLRAYKNLIKDKFRGDSAIETWLYRIAVNESLRMNQKLKREEEKQKKSISAFEMEPEEENMAEEMAQLKNAIPRLPEKYRDVLNLVFEGRSINEIALKLKIMPGTVKSRTSRGREMLQKLIRERVS
jgi:RNA polymerase sigma-70 factor (ECF subfamily)